MNLNRIENNVSLPKLELPKGGSSIKGLDEHFQGDAFTGAFSLNIPLDIPQSRGVTPLVSIDYSSSAGNGILGIGFGLQQQSISIRTSRALPKYDESDVFVWNDNVELVLKTGEKYEGEVAQYLERHQQAFVLIEKIIGPESVYWKITHNDNSVQFFGETENARIFNTDSPAKIFRWLVSREIDAAGNEVIYDYENWGTRTNKYLTRVRYGNYILDGNTYFAYSILFDYGQIKFKETDIDIAFEPDIFGEPIVRKDTLFDYRAGFLINTEYLIRNIFIQHNFVSDEKTGPDCFVNRVAFIYYDALNDANCCSRLKKVIHSGLKGTPYRNCYTVKSLPALELGYSSFPNEQNLIFNPITDQHERSIVERMNLVDLEREGISGILYRNAETVNYNRCKGDGKFDHSTQSLSAPTQFSNSVIPMNIVSLDGNGLLQIQWDNLQSSGYYPQKADNKWGEFRSFFSQSINNLAYRTEWVGMCGNNRADAVVITPDTIQFMPSFGLEGIGAIQIIPNHNKVEAFNLANVSPYVYFGFVDIFGDGLQHRVKLEEKKLSVWPNTGYGTFGKCISFDIPDLLIEERQIDLRQRLMFADINGNGCADIVLIDSGGIEVFFNLLGSRFTGKNFYSFGNDLQFTNFDSIQFADVKGDGRTCLILSKNTPHTFNDRQCEAAHYYSEVGYNGNEKVNKAFLLESINENMGSTTKVCYKSSLRDYLHDESIGKPWSIRLSAHVQVIDTITSYDYISNTAYTSRYRYRNGYYNPKEHSFAGFGYVEHSDLAINPEDPHCPPPLLTRQWFLVGIPVTQSVCMEFFAGDNHAPILSYDSQGRMGEEALYTLTGTLLREEVYEDTDEGRRCPLEVNYAQHEVVEMQKPYRDELNNLLHKGVYRQYQREALHFDYEKRVNDPIVRQQITLKIDEFNQVLRSVEVVYPRRTPLIAEQELVYCTSAETTLRNQYEKGVSRYIGVDIESKSFEVSVLQKPITGLYYSYKELFVNINIALDNPLPYQMSLSEKETSARLITWGKEYYWNSDQSDSLGENDNIPHVLLHHHSKSIAFDNSQRQQLGEGKISEADCRNAGYEWCDENQYWWVRSAVSHYCGKDQFYLLRRLSYDWVGKDTHLFTQSSIDYDDYLMFAVNSKSYLTDHIYLRKIAKIDYRILGPWQLIDENGNKSEVLTDELGTVIASAEYEKEGHEQGDLPLSRYNEQRVDDVEDVINNPRKYLQHAGAFFHYRFAYMENGIWHPTCVVTLTRTRYRSDEIKDIQTSVAYHDGFGRTVESRSYAGDDKWLASGRVQYNAKGDVARSWLGFFTDDWRYLDNEVWHKGKQAQLPPPSTFVYDALGRLVRTYTPKGFVTATQILNAWESRIYDESDTVLESPYYKSNEWETIPDEKDAIEKSIPFYNTPHTLVSDALGRQILAISSNKMNSVGEIDWRKEKLTRDDIDACDPDLLVQWQCFNIQGRVLTQADARLYEKNQNTGNKHFNFEHRYPIAAGFAWTRSADAGTTFGLIDVHGNAVISWDALGNKHSIIYDRLQRPLLQIVCETESTEIKIMGVTIYGEQAEDARAKNLLGKVWKQYDSAGKHLTDRYNFNGTLPESSLQLCKEFKTEMNWSSEVLDKESDALEEEVFVTATIYDALLRPIQQTLPDDSVAAWQYGQMGNCIQSTLSTQGEAQTIVSHSQLDANGQLTHYRYGNGTTTQHRYDEKTLELKEIVCMAKGSYLQKLNYWHDPTGLITTMNNETAPTVFYNNSEVRPVHRYRYDALYRLLQSSGRVLLSKNESAGSKKGNAALQVKKFAAGNMQAIGNYTDHYQYDKGNNLLQQQRTGDMQFTRNYAIEPYSNRVRCYSSGKEEHSLNYNAAGYMLNSHGAGSQKLRWNTQGNIASVTLVERINSASDTEYYVYSGGIRLRKIALRYDSAGKELSREDKIYLGAYTCRRFTGAATRHSITIGGVQKHDCVVQYSTDKKGRLLKNTTTGQQELIYRYQHGNHLDSVGMESNAEANIITYEEYNAFGDTVYSLNSEYENSKEYQYSAQEKDNNTQLYCYGYRYYAPWLCRWTRPDPAGTIDGFNLYAFVENEPIGRVDMMGLMKTRDKTVIRQLRPHSDLSKEQHRAFLEERHKQARKRKLSKFSRKLNGEKGFQDINYKDYPEGSYAHFRYRYKASELIEFKPRNYSSADTKAYVEVDHTPTDSSQRVEKKRVLSESQLYRVAVPLPQAWHRSHPTTTGGKNTDLDFKKEQRKRVQENKYDIALKLHLEKTFSHQYIPKNINAAAINSVIRHTETALDYALSYTPDGPSLHKNHVKGNSLIKIVEYNDIVNHLNTTLTTLETERNYAKEQLKRFTPKKVV